MSTDGSVVEVYDDIYSKTIWTNSNQRGSEETPQLNEELYDFVRDIKSAMGTSNTKSAVEDYLGRELNYEESQALENARVIKGFRSNSGPNRNKYKSRRY